MDPLQYAFMTIALFAAGCTIALYVWRAIYRAYTRWKDERDAAAAVARVEEQERIIMKSWSIPERGYTMKTASDIRHEVATTLGDQVDNYDVDAIIEELKDILAFDPREGYASVDTIENNHYWDIVSRHDIS